MSDRLAWAFLAVMAPLSFAVIYSMCNMSDPKPRPPSVYKLPELPPATQLSSEATASEPAAPARSKTSEEPAPATVESASKTDIASKPAASADQQAFSAFAAPKPLPKANDLAETKAAPADQSTPAAEESSNDEPKAEPAKASAPAFTALVPGSGFATVARPRAQAVLGQPPAPAKTMDLKIAEAPPYEMHLADGKYINVTGIFEEIQQSMNKVKETLEEEQERRTEVRVLNVTYPAGRTFVLLGRYLGKLNGTSVGLYESGSPMSHVSYTQNERNGNFCSWDERNRPIYLHQYKNDKKHGLCCLFKACGEECNHAHLWMVQEWEEGKLRKTHYVSGGETAKTFEYKDLDYQPVESEPDFKTAVDELTELDKQLDVNERSAITWISKYYGLVRNLARTKRQIVAVQRAAVYKALTTSLAKPRPLAVCSTGYGCSR